ncbi:IMP dehydrogenase [Eupransor demetentiae]|uniref:IMP dehydrogenase/GMP reductase (GuaB) n=1 Tax=Eupransor demetentiae TaxID=3109584 RepID=A0ABP0EN82_9LACO|nr:IMP dehydrogenase/GMP reductase (GuaB) [Lactobacillaceae bacterium LMG 33000]
MTNQASKQGLGYDQTLLVPAASSVLPHTVSLSSHLGTFKLKEPLVANAMGSESNDYAIPMALAGGLGVIAAEKDLDDQVAEIKKVKNHAVNIEESEKALLDDAGQLKVGTEVWLTDGVAERMNTLVDAGADAIFVYLNKALDDAAVKQLSELKHKFEKTLLVVGLIDDPKEAKQLYEAGIDTIIAGPSQNSAWPADHHYPFLTVTMDIAEVAADYDKAVIAGGGIHYSGDVVKAIAAGADAVMISDYLSGDESPKDAIFQIDGGLRAGMGYTGSADIATLQAQAQFVQITDNGLRESHPHDVQITKQAPNYVEQEKD